MHTPQGTYYVTVGREKHVLTHVEPHQMLSADTVEGVLGQLNCHKLSAFHTHWCPAAWLVAQEQGTAERERNILGQTCFT